jgi:cell division initiation protein
MPLTPLDLQTVQFSKAWRGYRCEQVDSFLQKAARDYEVIYKENLELKENLENIQSLLGTYRHIEDTMKNALIVAQKSAEEIKRLANHEALLLLSEARTQAENIKTTATMQVDESMRKYEEMQNKAEAFRANMRGFLLAQLELWEKGRRYNCPETISPRSFNSTDATE